MSNKLRYAHFRENLFCIIYFFFFFFFFCLFRLPLFFANGLLYSNGRTGQCGISDTRMTTLLFFIF